MGTARQTHAGHAAAESTGVNRLGFLLFITSEAVLFANLIAAYLYLRFSSAEWAPPGGLHVDLMLPAVNTVILLASGIPMHYAHTGIQQGNRRRLIWGLVLTILLGAIFMGGQAWEYTHAGFTPQGSIYGSTFFALTGFHGAHVIVGLLFLTVVLAWSLRGRVTAERHFSVAAGALYWHFVDIVWVVLFVVLYLL